MSFRVVRYVETVTQSKAIMQPFISLLEEALFNLQCGNRYDLSEMYYNALSNEIDDNSFNDEDTVVDVVLLDNGLPSSQFFAF